jgi:hypothetical protein
LALGALWAEKKSLAWEGAFSPPKGRGFGSFEATEAFAGRGIPMSNKTESLAMSQNPNLILFNFFVL